MISEDLARYIVLWGPGILILIVFAYGFMRLAYHWIDRTTDIKRKQLDSAFDIARDYVGQLAEPPSRRPRPFPDWPAPSSTATRLKATSTRRC